MCLIEYYTYEDYKNWEGNWELIRGMPLAMAPSPVISHQIVATNIATELNSNKKCEECIAVMEEDWIIEEDTVVKPDVSFICSIESDFIIKPPEIVVEVVSKSTAKRDEKIKKEIYEKEGVKYYILVYPNFLKARIFKNENGFKKVGEFSKETFEFNLPCKTKIDFEKVFKILRRRK
ncbi:Uma2 family endonuclease [Caminibacter sp.]